MKIKQIFGFILLAAAIFGLGRKLLSGMSGYFDDGLVVVLVVMIISVFLLFGIRQILRS